MYLNLLFIKINFYLKHPAKNLWLSIKISLSILTPPPTRYFKKMRDYLMLLTMMGNILHVCPIRDILRTSEYTVLTATFHLHN